MAARFLLAALVRAARRTLAPSLKEPVWSCQCGQSPSFKILPPNFAARHSLVKAGCLKVCPPTVSWMQTFRFSFGQSSAAKARPPMEQITVAVTRSNNDFTARMRISFSPDNGPITTKNVACVLLREKPTLLSTSDVLRLVPICRLYGPRIT